ncbi:DUF1214 domain-containing protein [Pseudomonas sp. H9]|uniref:DUF1214 domain-containing protein n=1 Tax=Pseudomonas sp. H9 TaxID=483968 RepID=UPI0010579B35|nr:DUF1214 domain-containing protein [Pseudomonas sp. H9]TDF83934.1 DUF1254 domain-containing protein [Pseudomonas sp. H9]
MPVRKLPLRPFAWIAPLCLAGHAHAAGVPVTVDNFVRAESHTFFTRVVARGGFGTLVHNRDLVPVDSQVVVRPNRDTLYSSAVFDLDAGAVNVTLPDAGKRYFSLIAINEDQYTPGLVYAPGDYRFTRETVGSRYVLLGIRTLVDPASATDMAQGRALQDAIQIRQEGSGGRFEVPNWDQASLNALRDTVLKLAASVTDSRGMYGQPGEVDPVRHFIGSASAWGGNPAKDAYYLNVTPARNDGHTPYQLEVKDVPVDAFWSISVYNAEGYFQRNPQNAYTLNNLTAKRETDGRIVVHFGGCQAQVANCLPITANWNYMVRLYKPQAQVLDGRWQFPAAKPAS